MSIIRPKKAVNCITRSIVRLQAYSSYLQDPNGGRGKFVNPYTRSYSLTQATAAMLDTVKHLLAWGLESFRVDHSSQPKETEGSSGGEHFYYLPFGARTYHLMQS